MKAVKVSLVIMAAALITLGLSGGAYAFHRGGVAECSGCHSMHSPGGSHLLLYSDASSTCLECHEHAGDTGPSSYHVSTAVADMPAGTAPLQRSPGGDFGWLKKSYAWTSRGEALSEDGARHGHSIKAVDKGYDPDPRNAPGGSYSGSNLGCQSCHDPHGKGRRLNDGSYVSTGAPIYTSGSTGTVPSAGLAVGTFNLLAGPYYTGAPGATYTSWPVAVRPSSYNRSEATSQTRVAYSASGTDTWGKWCGTCHGGIANETGLAGHPSHVVDNTLSAGIATNYNAYVGSGNMTGSFTAYPGPYSSLVPFAEDNTLSILTSHARSDNNALALGGPSTSDQVTCLSCHRAHASGWPHALRWNYETTFMVSGGAYPAEMGRSLAETQAAYYDRPVAAFGAYQRSLCNKCHAKD